MKKTVRILAAVVIVAAAVFGFILWRAWSEASAAVSAYNEAAQEYNTKIEPYNQAAAEVAAANQELKDVLDAADLVLEEGADAYEPETLEKLREEAEEAGKAFVEVPVQIDPFEVRSVTGSMHKSELEVQKAEAEAALAAVRAAQEKIPPVPEVPDYSAQIKEVREAQKAYTDSVQKLVNVTAPPDSFVLERLTGIETVVAAEAVSEKNDPNGLLGKKDGYKGCVYFLDSRVDRDLLPEEAFRDNEEETEQVEDSAETDRAAAENPEESGTEASTAAAAGESASSEASAPAAAESTDAGETSAASTENAAAGGASAAAAAAENAAAGETSTAAEAAENASARETASASGSAASGAAASSETAASAELYSGQGPRIDVVLIGTAGGGAVEVYATAEEAEKREEYLAYFEGSVMDPGAHTVEGTCVIRASRYLSEEEQKKLMKTVREALLAVE